MGEAVKSVSGNPRNDAYRSGVTKFVTPEERAKIISDMQKRLRDAVGDDRSIVDEFIAEKREEARREYEG